MIRLYNTTGGLALPNDSGIFGGGSVPLIPWLYRKPITVTNAVASYQTKILLGESSGATGEEVDCGGKCLSTFNDLRFTSSDGTTLLDYWIESITGTTPNQLATVWVENDATPSTTCYMYYGNAAASAVSSGTSTFPLLFDHFADASLDAALWRTFNAPHTVTESGTLLTVGGNGNNVRWEGVQSIGTWTYNVAARASVRLVTDGTAFGFSNTTNLGSDDAAFVFAWTDGNQYYRTYNEAASTSAAGAQDHTNYYVYDIMWDDDTAARGQLFQGGVSKLNSTTNVPDEAMNLYMAYYDTSSAYSIIVDWVFLRKFSNNTEPTFAFGTEEPTYVPTFTAQTNNIRIRA